MKTYKVTFMAELSEDDVRAMNKCFFDAMNEAMNIHNLFNLEVTSVEDDSSSDLEKCLAKPLTHINDVKQAFSLCKSSRDVEAVINRIPAMFGSFTVEYDLKNDGFTVCNDFYDTDDYCIEEFWIDFPDGWEYDTKDEENAD